jgi:glycosyltransferase involved in cell wall biosynthesis
VHIALFTETFFPHSDGIVTRLAHTITALQQNGDHVLVITPDIPGLPTSFQGAEVIGTPCLPLPLYQGFYIGSPILNKHVREALDCFAPDIVHTANPVFVGRAAVVYARQRKIPLVASYHTNIPTYARRYGLGLLERPARWYLWQLHNRARINLCTSRTIQAQLIEQGMQRVNVWGPGVDSELFHPAKRTHSWRVRLTNGDPDKTILLYVGRLATEKGLDQILDVLPQVKNCHMAFVGNGPLDEKLQQEARDLPVTFLGSLSGEDLASAYASADIFVFPSSTETLGLVAMEAMAAGLPVVGARRGGLLDSIVDGETGLLFEPNDIQDFARALNFLLSHPGEREAMGFASRQRAETWSWTAATQGLRDYYTQLIALPGEENVPVSQTS